MKRRDLLKNIALGTGTLFVLPSIVTSCEEEQPEPDGNNGNTLTIDLTDSQYSSLTSPGGSMPKGNILIINTGDGFIALSKICTHQGCNVSYDAANKNLPCPCHGSVFSTSGSVLIGPATIPLRKYTIIQEGDVLTIKL